MMYFFWRLFNGFLLLFFIVHVIRARSVVAPVRDTLVTVTGWLGTAGEQTEKKLMNAITTAKDQLE